MSLRTEKLNRLIQKQLGAIVPAYLEDYNHVIATITEVDTSPDLGQCKVWLSLYNTQDEKEKKKVLKILEKNIYAIQGDFNKAIVLKKNPRIKFILDASGDEITRLTSIFEEGK